MPEVTEEKKKRTKQPRAPSKQAVLDAVYEWMEKPFVRQRDAVFKAMLEHKRLTWGDHDISAL